MKPAGAEVPAGKDEAMKKTVLWLAEQDGTIVQGNMATSNNPFGKYSASAVVQNEAEHKLVLDFMRKFAEARERSNAEPAGELTWVEFVMEE